MVDAKCEDAVETVAGQLEKTKDRIKGQALQHDSWRLGKTSSLWYLAAETWIMARRSIPKEEYKRYTRRR